MTGVFNFELFLSSRVRNKILANTSIIENVNTTTLENRQQQQGENGRHSTEREYIKHGHNQVNTITQTRGTTQNGDVQPDERR